MKAIARKFPHLLLTPPFSSWSVVSRGSKGGREGGLHKTPPWLPWQKSLLWMSLLFGGGGGGGGGDPADTMLVSPSRILGVTVTLVAFAGGGMAMDVSY